MRISVKLSIVFCLAALFLLAVEVGAVFVVDHLNTILSDTTYFNQQSGTINEALHHLRLTPERIDDHKARVDDLYNWARTENERRILREARYHLTSGQVANATEHLEQLSTEYNKQMEKAHRTLLNIHHRLVIGIIVITIDSLLLFLLLTWLVRYWLVNPVTDLSESIQMIAAGNLQQKIASSAGAEFDDIAKSLNKITAQLRDANERLAQSERLAAVGEACSHVTHNVRSLLNSIRSLAQHESSSKAADPDSRVGFNYIIATVNKLDGWVRDLHSSISPHKPNAASHQIEPIIHDVLSLLQPSLSERNLTVDYRATEELPDVVMDRALFEQAFTAVIANAIEASPDDGHISILLKNSDDNRVTLLIEDVGAGMTEETRGRVFDAFFTTKPDSAGLGLTIAQFIIKNHGGQIEIESAPAKGTRVCIHLPAAKPGSKPGC